MFILSWSLFVVPWTATVASTAWLTNVVYSIIGICSSFLMIGKIMLVLDMIYLHMIKSDGIEIKFRNDEF